MDKLTDGLVKGVLSGDTVIISGKVDKLSDKAPDEYLLSFVLVNAPKAFNNSNNNEEPWGWESRNFLRNLVCGKVVKFTVDYKVGDRCIGQVYLDNKNIALEVVRRGFAKVGQINKQNEYLTKTEYYNKLQNFETDAKKKKEGVWNTDKETISKLKRTITRFDDKDFDFKAVETACKGKEVEVMVEHVINCSGYSLFIKDLNCLIRFNPRFLAIPNNQKEPVIYKAGKAFVERLILHRDFKIKILGIDDNKNFYGDFLGVKGDLVLLVLRGGYTKLFTGNYNATNDELVALKGAQTAAQNERLRLWKNYINLDEEPTSIKVNQPIKSGNKQSFEGVCLQAHSGDCITVRRKGTGEQIRIFLTHLKAPKMSNNSETSDEPWANQGKEHLRKLLVGKRVFCEHDYSKNVDVVNKETKQKVSREMSFYSVIKIAEGDGQDLNVNADVIRNGFANYMAPRGEDVPSKHIDLFSEAFEEAKTKKLGIHSGKIPPLITFSDLFAANKQKIREFKDFLVGQRGTACMVEHVISGSRYKLKVFNKKCLVPFNLLGIKTFHQDKNNTELCNNLYQMSVDFVCDVLLQREATCDIVQCDRQGNYFGYIYFNGENFGNTILKNGFGVLNAGLSGNFSALNQFKKSEDYAKENKMNIWKYDGLVSMLKEGGESDSTIKPLSTPIDTLVKVSEFVDFLEFFVNYSPNTNLDKVCSVLADYDSGKLKGVKLEPPIRKGIVCAAKYSNDESYYRANITNILKDSRYEVEFIDYGTIEEVEELDLIKLDTSIGHIEPQAVFCELAFLKLSSQAMKKALVTFKNFGVDPTKQYYGKVFYNYASEGRQKNGIVIFNDKDKSIKKSLQYDLLEQGLAKLDAKKGIPDSLKNDLLEAQKTAKTKGIGMWLDIETSDNEEEN